jgi:hypothetical protein
MSADLKQESRDWRWLIVVLVLGYALLTIGVPALKLASEKQLLQGLGVAALDHPFMDLRGVAAWCDAAKAGKDPAVTPTWIPLPGGESSHPNFLMNYSPVVLLFGKMGLSGHTVIGWGIVLVLLYTASLWLLCGSCSLWRALFWVLLICSPASVLAVERGNLDTLLFALLVLALLVRKHPWAEALVIFVAAVLKFFPIAALAALWKNRGKYSRIATGAAGVAFLIFLGLLHDRLAAISGSLAAQCQTSFGSTTILDLLAHAGVIALGLSTRLHLLFKLMSLTALTVSFVAGAFLTEKTKGMVLSARSVHAFFLTAPMMLGLYVLGPQMDYKWIFFLFMVPAGLELIHSTCQRESFAAKAWLIAMTLYSYWTFFSDERSLRNSLLKQILMGVVMLLSAFLAGRLWRSKTSA